ncbi:MAG TPA: DNA-processing protein DprA, partial [Acidimicrobiales bacterium]
MRAERASELPPEAYAVALASLPSMGPSRLRTLLADEPPALAWERATAQSTASQRDVVRAWQRQIASGIRVLLAGRPGYPARLEVDPQAPPLLFCLGDPAALADTPTVALVGTRAPT